MSRAFVKEPDGDESIGDLPDRPVSPHPNYVTPSGLRLLKDALVQVGKDAAKALVLARFVGVDHSFLGDVLT